MGRSTGALIGGTIVGSLAEGLASALCGDTDSNEGPCSVGHTEHAFLIGGLIGAIPGGMIGSGLHKPVPPDRWEQVGNRGLLGALVLGVPSLAVGVLGARDNLDCELRSDCMIDAVLTGLLNAAIGYFIGNTIHRWGAASPAVVVRSRPTA